MIVERNLTVETLQQLVDLLPTGRARRRYEVMLETAIDPFRTLVLKEVELVLLQTELVHNPRMDYSIQKELAILEGEIESLRDHFVQKKCQRDG